MKNTTTQVSDLIEEIILPIHYWVDDDGVKHIDYDLLVEKYEEEMFKLRALKIN